MRRAWTWWLAWAVLLVTLGLYVFAAAIVQKVGYSAATQQGSWIARGALLVAFTSFAVVGALVLARQPRNAVGWIFSAVGLLVGLNVAGGEWANYVYVVHHGALPGGVLGAWFYLWSWFPSLGMAVLLPMVFPTGHAPTPRWRHVLRAETVAIAVIAVLWMLEPGPMNDPGKPLYPHNPIGVAALEPLYGPLDAISAASIVLLLALAAVAAVFRFRRAGGDEKEQLKWMTYGIGTWIVWIPLSLAFSGDFGDTMLACALAVLPLATAVAMFKYRLYEIDRVISRTLVYGLVTVILGAAYAGLVLAGQAVFSSFAGGSNLAIAGSTLVVAALFLPLRGRVQLVVDRRFYRRRYDTQRILETFGLRLRQQIDLAVIANELLTAAQDTMQPVHTTLWLRGRSDR